MAEEHPKLRPVDILPVQGGRQFLLRDPARLAAKEIVLPADMLFLLSQFDGHNSVREAQVNYVRRFGTLLTTEKIEEFLRKMDQALLLDSPLFREVKAQLEEDFKNETARRMTRAGQSYDKEAAAFARTWQAAVDQADLPGGFSLDEQRPLLIAPHYELSQAADCYGAAYRLLGAVNTPEVVVILGVAHSGNNAPFVLTRKAFETPFGLLDSDEELIIRLAKAAPFDLFGDEFLHRDEHSIEFQAVLLHWLYRKNPPNIVPLLCGPFHRKKGEVANPKDRATVVDFLEAAKKILAADPRRVAIIASVDFAHIGARFGQAPVTQAHLEATRRHDHALIEKATAGDAEGFYAVLAQSSDRFNICGFSAIYTLLSMAEISGGQLLSYRQLVEHASQSAVTFASVGLR